LPSTTAVISRILRFVPWISLSFEQARAAIFDFSEFF
jgi:hypothetical protein